MHDEAFPNAVIDRIAYYSGGVRWDFFSMMMDAAGEAWDAEVMEIGDEIVDAVLLDARRRKEMLLLDTAPRPVRIGRSSPSGTFVPLGDPLALPDPQA